MHNIEPYHNWMALYQATEDPFSPFFGKQYNFETYSQAIYNYYINPAWDYMGSETLYIKVLFVNYDQQFAIIELMGEWNDAINNDIMHLKRNILENMMQHGINKFILIGENVLNFHGSDDCYYEEWFEEVEDGWIACLNFRDFVQAEWKKFRLDYYLNFGGQLEIHQWRTLKPAQFFTLVDQLIQHRLGS